MTTSLIITTYNWPEALALVLKSVLTQTRFPNEIIMADDGSRGDTAKLIKSVSESTEISIIHVWQKDDGFRAASIRNKAIRKATGEYLILIDGDMILHSCFMENHIDYAKENSFVQGSRVLIKEEKTKEVLKTKMCNFTFFNMGLGNRKNAIYSNFLANIFSKNNNTLKGIKTCNFALYRKDAFKVNGFDEEFVGWGREDSEFAVRLLNFGIERNDIKFHAIAYHLYHNENTRQSLLENDDRLHNSIEKKLKWCEKGLV